VNEDGATGRSPADAPEIDGNVYLDGETRLKPGDLVQATIVQADEYDLWGSTVR
jgi:ribosomal protein S12 methylthiotransferase